MFKDRLSDNAKINVRKLLSSVGLEIGSYKGSFVQHRLKLLRDLSVRTVWDVGAHVGQYSRSLRDHGYVGDIVSIEPSTTAHASLKRRSEADRAWTVIRAAAGGYEAQGTLNISRNGQSSSLLSMLGRHLDAAPGSAYVATEEVNVIPLDLLVEQISPPTPFALKLDVQGFELAALDGADRLLLDTVVVEVELSLSPLYEGGADWLEVIGRMSAAGLRLCDLERVYHDRDSGDLLQINGLFRRHESELPVALDP